MIFLAAIVTLAAVPKVALSGVSLVALGTLWHQRRLIFLGFFPRCVSSFGTPIVWSIRYSLASSSSPILIPRSQFTATITLSLETGAAAPIEVP